jgi:hypothetical protein
MRECQDHDIHVLRGLPDSVKPARRSAAKVVLLLLGAAGFGAAGLVLYSRSRAPKPATLAHLEPVEVPSALVDPLEPDRPPAPREQPAISAASASAWVGARPAPEFREKRTAHVQAAGAQPSASAVVNGCDTPDPGWGDYLPGEMCGGSYVMMPREPVRPDGTFDVVLHFHGHELAMKEFLRARTRFVFVGTSAKGYSDRLSGAQGLTRMVELAEQAVKDRAGKPARARRVVLAAWSGGFEAVSILLEQSERKPDAVLLLDGLHGSRDPSVLALQLASIVGFARRAQKNEVFMFVSHSSVDTDGYASSTEGVHFLEHTLGARPLPVERADPFGMRLIELYSQGGFHARGYAGGARSDHCAQLTLYPTALRALGRRWR